MALIKPTPGGDNGTWGAKLNDALDDLDERVTAAGAGASDAGVADLVDDPVSATRTALSATYAAVWKPNTAYAAGARVVNPSGDIVLAKTAFTSGATYDPANWTLPGTYARSDTATHEAIKAEVKRSRGGRIGTNGKPAVAIRIDHGVDDFLSTFWPLMKARNIPGGLGVMSRCMENPSDAYEPTSTTWAALFTEHKNGFEVWCHSHSHQDPNVIGTTLKQEITDSKAVIESHGFRVPGFQMPGITPTTTPNYSTLWSAASSWKSEVGQLLLANYGLIQVEGIIGGARRSLPTDGCYDLGHYTLDGMTYTTAKGLLDSAIASGFSTEWMLHPRFINAGTVTHTVAFFTQFLDYLVTLRNAGTIEILTPSGLAFATPDTSRRFDPVVDGSFETSAVPTTSTTPWTLGGAALPVTIPSDGGHTGSKYLHIPASAGLGTYIAQGWDLSGTSIPGAILQVEAWARCTGSNTEASITVQDSGTPANLNVQKYINLVAGSGWQRVWNIFTMPQVSNLLSIRLARRVGTGDIDFDDVRVTPI